MADTPPTSDNHQETLNFLANFLRDHEKNLDRTVDALASVIEQMRPAENLLAKIADLEKKLCELEESISELTWRIKHQKEP